jgi:hypothetical protein
MFVCKQLIEADDDDDDGNKNNHTRGCNGSYTGHTRNAKIPFLLASQSKPAASQIVWTHNGQMQQESIRSILVESSQRR